MDFNKIKKYILETAPSYDKMYENKTETGNIIQAKSNLGFTRIFYPGMHIEGDKKIFLRKNKNQIYKKFRYFGPKGELLWGIGIFFTFSILTKNNMERERLNSYLVDKNVYYYPKYGKCSEVNKIE